MELDSQGNVVKQVPTGFVMNKKTGLLNKFSTPPITSKAHPTKAARKQFRTEKNAERKMTPQMSDALAAGYNYIFTVLGRGCSVSAA